jgi:hypothetical protein
MLCQLLWLPPSGDYHLQELRLQAVAALHTAHTALTWHVVWLCTLLIARGACSALKHTNDALAASSKEHTYTQDVSLQVWFVSQTIVFYNLSATTCLPHYGLLPLCPLWC